MSDLGASSLPFVQSFSRQSKLWRENPFFGSASDDNHGSRLTPFLAIDLPSPACAGSFEYTSSPLPI
jgi:hypothetical protein